MVFFVKRAQDIALSTFIHMQGEGGGLQFTHNSFICKRFLEK